MRGEERIIYKYPLYARHNYIDIAKGSKFLLFGMQDWVTTAWFEVPRGKAPERILLTIMPTGESFHDDSTHLGSIQDGAFVWHLYKDNNNREL